MRPKQYHNRAFALPVIALAFLCFTFTLQGQSQAERNFSRGVADSLSLTGMTSISFGDRVLLHDLQLSVASLDSASVPPMDYGMINVTVQGEGCRFLPHGIHFGGEGATVRLHYDRTRIPSGYTEDDIRTYYYDTSLERWIALERIEVDRETATVVSRTTHFTDMVNGVIVTPETPETGAFVPTMMTDIQAADPTSRLTFIMPPTANNRGSANLQYPFEMPPARNGMQPSLALTYDSDGGSGWAGEGWDIRVPAITVDTRWGVPRYSTEFESETYLLNGQMLAMMSGSQMTVAHRQDSIPRDTCRMFFVRQGGDFSKIVRHGDSPNNYWWEVTSRDGTIYTYGSTEPSRVHGNYKGTSDSQPRDVIAEWRLTGVKETHGDSIGYVWQAADVPLYGGTITAREVWLSEVTAKNQERTAPHTRVTFHNREQGKAMSTNSARYGFLTTSTRLLGSVDINFRADTIGDYGALRTYAMSYEEGVFHRDRLTRIDHIVAGDTVSFQTFDYYDDVRAGNGIAPFESDSTSFSDSAAVMVTAFNQPVPQGHSGHGTLLGGTFSKTYSGSLYAGVGLGATPGKSMTAGASFGYSHTSATGEAAFIDLDGDGLPDKVFKEDGVVKYSRQLITSDGTHFGAAVPLAAGEGVSLADFSRSKTSTVTGGPKAYLGYGPAFGEFGSDFMSSTTKTTHYFADVNGDGLADIVAGGKVLFNHIENGVPTFTLSSGHTPSPINNTGEIDTSSLEVLNDSRDSLVALSPMQDIVRYWDAPLSGTVDITGTVTRLLPPEDYDPDEYALADSLRVSVQKNGQELWWRSIARGDTSPHASDVASVPVQKGDRILFRLQCGYDPVSNGSFDRALWPVAVEYTDKGAAPAAPDGMSPLRYTSGDPAVSLTGTMLPVDSSAVAVVYSLHKPATTDDVSFSVRYHASGLPEPLPAGWTVELADSIAAHTLTVSAGNVQSVDSAVLELPAELREGFLSFVISSASNVRWSDIHWSTALRYVQDRDGTADTTDVAAMPQCRAYNRMTRYAPPITAVSPLYADEPDGTMCPFACVPSFSCSSSQTGTVTLTLKSGDTVYARRTYSLQNGGIASSRFWVMLPVRGKVWAEYFTGSAEVAQSVLLARVQLEADTLNPLASSGVVTPLRHPASVHCIDDGGDLGPTYRGWGQLVYNAGGGRSACPIAPSDLSLPQDSDHCDPQTMRVALLTARDGDPTWLVGAKTDIFIHGDTLSTARLADNHVDPLPLFGELATVSGAQEGMDLKGTAARGLTLVSQANSDDGIISAGAFGVGFSHNDATGRGVNKNAFIDMNGDGYPDIVTEGSIQYTNTLGGFANGGSLDRSTMQLDVSEQGMFSDNGASSNGYGGGPVHSFSINRSGGTEAVSQANASVAASINGTASENWDKMRFNYLDINGDGLPDMLSVHNDSSLHVRLNLGYGFTDEFCLTGVTRLQRTVTGTISASLSGSFNIDASSFAGGMGVSTSTSRPSHALMDVNGDGLPDMVWMDGFMKVRLNLGDSFASEELDWNGAWNIGKTGATTLSLNTSYTYSPFLLGVKIAISPSLHMAWGMTRPEMELRDIDGDGFIDILESDGENDLRVRRSTIRRTNRLRSVTNSLGGKFEIDYEHSTPTYGLPGGKWVMSSVTVDRGIHGNDYDIPNTRQTFDYANGVRDRHEREFLGFGEVRTWQVDPGNGNAPLRQTVEVYDTASVYTAGSLLLTYVADPQGNRYGETRNTYYTYALTNDCDNSAYNGGRFSFDKDAFSRWNDRGAAYCPTRFTETRRFEGGSDSTVMAQDWYQYYDRTGDHGLLRKYRHCVGGGLTESGGGTYNYQTNVEYNYNLSDTAYIIGMPKRVKVTDKRESLYHLTEATYDRGHPNQITQIKRMLTTDAWVPAGPIGRGDGTGTGTNAVVDGIGGGVITPFGRYNPDQEPRTNAEDYHNPVYAITDYSYDLHGNLHTVRLPDNGSNQRMTYTYTYDGLQNMHLVDVQDSLNFSSTFGTLDYRFGIARSHNDINNARTYSYVDNLSFTRPFQPPVTS